MTPDRSDPPFNIQNSTFKIQHSKFNIQNSTFKIQKMSTPKKFSELPLVSDIGAAKMLVVDDTGVKRAAKPEPYPQPRRTLPYATDDADTWYRIANINKSGLGLVFLNQVYSYASPRSVILAVAADGWGTNPQTGTDVRLVAGVPTYFKKARIVCDAWNTDNSAWLDVLVAKSRNSGSVYIFGVNINSVDSVTKNPSVESALSVKEFDLTQSGGVVCCTAVGPYRVTVTQKGGQHEHRSESAERKRTSCSISERIGISGRESRVAGQIHSDGSVLHLPDLRNNGDTILAMGCSDGTEQSHDCSSILPNDWIPHIISSLVAGRLVSVDAVGRDTVHGNNLLISRKEVVVA